MRIQVDGVGTVEVGDEFGKMSPEDQSAFVAHITEQAGQGMKSSLPKTVYRGSVLPFSRDENGKVSFDSDAGVVGSIKRAFSLPGEVVRGKVDPYSDEGIGRAFEMGTVVSPTTPAARAAGMSSIGTKLPQKPAWKLQTPSAEELRAASDAGYESARGMGVEYAPEAVRDLAMRAQRGLEADGAIGELAPQTFAVLGKLANPPPGSTAPFTGLEAARRSFVNIGKDFGHPTEQMASGRVKGLLDEFFESADPSAFVAGRENGPALAATAKDARANYAASMRSDTISEIGDGIALRNAAAGSGLNIDNTTRGKVASLLQSKKRSAGFNDDEIAALTKIVEGTPARNAMRYAGNILGGGGGLGAGVTGGAATGVGAMMGLDPLSIGLLGAGVPAVGYGLRKAANSAATRALDNADKLTRQRSPLFQQMQKTVPQVEQDAAMQEFLARFMLGAQTQNQP